MMVWFLFATIFDFLDKYDTNSNANVEGCTFLARLLLLGVLITAFWEPVPYLYHAANKWDDYGLNNQFHMYFLDHNISHTNLFIFLFYFTPLYLVVYF